MRKALSVVVLSMLVIAILPLGTEASVNVGDATVDLFAASLDAYVPNPGDFNYFIVGDGWPVTIVLDCEVDDNNIVDNITTLIKMHGHLYCPATYPTVLGFELDDWFNPSAPATDNTAIWPMGRTDTDQLSISFGDVPSGYFIDVVITADIYSEGQDDTAHDEIEFRVTII
jgi:hypothetical protein